MTVEMTRQPPSNGPLAKARRTLEGQRGGLKLKLKLDLKVGRVMNENLASEVMVDISTSCGVCNTRRPRSPGRTKIGDRLTPAIPDNAENAGGLKGVARRVGFVLPSVCRPESGQNLRQHARVLAPRRALRAPRTDMHT